MIIRIPKSISGGLVLSYKCNAECQHCMYACSPKWKDDWITIEDLTIILEQLSSVIEPSPHGSDSISLNHGLHLTGGEPFLNFDLLCKAIEIANDYHIPSIFVETNGFWAVNDKATREKLLILKKKGLNGILISVNPFYLEYVSFERTDRAVRMSYEIFGSNMFIYQFEYYKRFKELGIQDRMLFKDFLKIEKQNDFARNAEFFISGRAPYKIQLEGIYPKYPADMFFRYHCQPSFLRNWHNHFDNYGNFIPGYCGGLSIGDCRQLNQLIDNGIDGDEYPVLQFLVNDDMEGLFSFSKKYGYSENQEGYFSKCHLCVDIRKHLLGKGDFKELRPEEFYLHLERN